MKHARTKPGLLDRQASMHETNVATHVRLVKRNLEKFMALKPDDSANIQGTVEDFLTLYPPRAATREQVALHEVGHFVAFEIFGLGAWSATIRGSSGGHYGWSGTARPLEERFNPWDTPTAIDLIAEAKITLAGPWAEELLGRGDAMSSTSEILETYVLIAKAAAMTGKDLLTLLSKTLSEVTEFIVRYEDEIFEIADRLKRAKKITRDQIKRPLASVKSKRQMNCARGRSIDDGWLQLEVISLPAAKTLVQGLLDVRNGKWGEQDA